MGLRKSIRKALLQESLSTVQKIVDKYFDIMFKVEPHRVMKNMVLCMTYLEPKSKGLDRILIFSSWRLVDKEIDGMKITFVHNYDFNLPNRSVYGPFAGLEDDFNTFLYNKTKEYIEYNFK